MTMREVAQQVWQVIDYNGGFYETDFDAWFKDCWQECMEEAINNILNGGWDWENGSYIEVSKNISKDGNTHNIDVEKEHIIEYLGEENCWKTFTLQKDIAEDLMSYVAGSPVSEFYGNEELQLFSEFAKEWNSLPCDDDGFSSEQEAEADELIEEYAQLIFNKINS